MIPRFGRNVFVRVALVAIAIVLVAATSPAQVTIDFDVTGNAVPGGTVDVTANVTINDDSTLQSYSWTQVGGAEAMLSGTGTKTVTAALGTEADYKAYLIHVLMEPPITEEQLPPNVPLPEGEFPAVSRTASRSWASTPSRSSTPRLWCSRSRWSPPPAPITARSTSRPPSRGRSRPVYSTCRSALRSCSTARSRASYDWTLSAPSGSGATLKDASSQNPTFTPDVPGHYTVEVDQEGTKELVTMSVYAGTWLGVIVGQDEEGRPVSDSSCIGCHNDKTAAGHLHRLGADRPRRDLHQPDSTPAPTTVRTALPATRSASTPAPTTTASTRPMTTRRSSTPG